MDSNIIYPPFLNFENEWVKANIEELENGVYQLTTPFLTPHNDFIELYIRPMPEKDEEQKNEAFYILSDDGQTIADIYMQGVDIEAETTRITIKKLQDRYGFSIAENDALELQTSEKDFTRQKSRLLQAIISLQALFMNMKEEYATA